jgi:hypothetical protein
MTLRTGNLAFGFVSIRLVIPFLESRARPISAGLREHVNLHNRIEHERDGQVYTFNSQRVEAWSCDRWYDQLPSLLNPIPLVLNQIPWPPKRPNGKVFPGIEQFSGMFTPNPGKILISLPLVRIVSIKWFLCPYTCHAQPRDAIRALHPGPILPTWLAKSHPGYVPNSIWLANYAWRLRSLYHANRVSQTRTSHQRGNCVTR